VITDLSKALANSVNKTARLINGVGSAKNLSGLIIDRFDTCALVHTYSANWLALKDPIANELTLIGVRDAVLWNRELDAKETTKRGAEVLMGTPPEVLTCELDGISLLLKPFKTASGGIFLDTGEIRRELLAHSVGKRVLNLFCFTGSLGIAAAVGGAREVVQVDISQSVLEWAKENAAQNEIRDTIFKYYTDDATDVLQRAARRLEKGSDTHGFDTIIIDPPAFGTTGSKRFDLSKQISELLDLALKSAAKDFTIYLMCNETKISAASLRAQVPDKLKVREISAPVSTHPGDLRDFSVMRGIVISN